MRQLVQGIYTCKEETAANPQRPATGGSCKERIHSELERRWGKGAAPAR